MKNLPAMKTVLLFSAGIIIGRCHSLPPRLTMGILAVLTAVIILLFYRKKSNRTFQILLGFLMIGLGAVRIHHASHYFPKRHIVHHLYRSEPVTLTGVLMKDPVEKSGRTELLIKSVKIEAADTAVAVCGKTGVTIYDDRKLPFRYGDEITVRDRLIKPLEKRNPGGFDYRSYLAGRRIHVIMQLSDINLLQATGRTKGNPVIKRLVYPVRRSMIKNIHAIMPKSSRAILKALLLGEKNTLTPEIREAFGKAGVIHLLAVSGLHVGYILIILTVIASLLRLPYPVRISLILTGLTLYVLLTEVHPPVVRAAVMAGIALTGTLLERQTNPFNTIGMAAFCILIGNPSALFDISFQLSFTAVLSILYFYPLLSTWAPVEKILRKLHKRKILVYGMRIFLGSLAVQIGTLPLTAYYFNRVPLLSAAVNIIAIPLTGIIVALGFTVLFFGMFSPWIATVYAGLNHFLIGCLQSLAAKTAALPFSSLNIYSPGFFHIIAYGTLVLMIFHGTNLRIRRILLLFLLAGLNGIVWQSAIRNETGRLTWVQFDVGQGDAALLQLPRGKTLLIDGGNRTDAFDNGKSVIAPYLRKKGIHRLNGIILSHPHNDHIGGLIYLANHIKVDTFYFAGTPFYSRDYETFVRTLASQRIPTRIITAPDSLIHFPGIHLHFLSPDLTIKKQTENPPFEPNNQSLVTHIQFGRTALLFMGDAHRMIENRLLQSGRLSACDALKVGHHGSETSTGNRFLEQLRPEFAVISVGRRNRFHHPSPLVIRRLLAIPAQVLRTDRDGALVLVSDGSTFRRIHWK